ncbi:MAG: flagellar motor switch protein FliG [Candidatus Kapaibacterium sp.]
MAKELEISRHLTYERLNGKQKVAILLMTLDVDNAAKIYSQLDPKDVESIAVEISTLKGVSKDIIHRVNEDFFELMTAHGYYLDGGLDYALTLLQKSFGPERAKEILDKIKILTTIRGFDILRKADPQQLASFLSKEHPQTIALILSHLTPDQSSDLLSEFTDELRADTLVRIATLGKVSPSIIAEVEAVVDQIGDAVLSQNLAATGGAQLVAAILNKTNNATAKSLLESIEERNPGLSGEIKRLMFLFEDIIMIDDKGIQRILREVDKRDLAMALKVADEKIQTKIFKNMSERAAEVIREELEFMGPVKLKDVEAAQVRIVDVIKVLEERDEIVISGRGSEDGFV